MRLTGPTKRIIFFPKNGLSLKAGKSVPEIESAGRLSFENVFLRFVKVKLKQD